VASPFLRYPPHSPSDASHPGLHTSQDRFPSSAFITTCQAFASCTCALVYLLVERSRKGGKGGFKTLVGWEEEMVTSASNGSAVNGSGKDKTVATPTGKEPVATSWTRTLPVLLLRVGVCQSLAAPIGFMSLRYISYPTMVLAKVSHGHAL
jgi:UDP-galactose transporter B1